MRNESFSQKNELEDALQALRKNYVAAWPGKYADMLENFRKAKENESAQEGLTSLRFSFHKLAGTGTTYGFPGVTGQAREAEEIVAGCLNSGQTLSGGEFTRIQSLIHALDDVFRGSAET